MSRHPFNPTRMLARWAKLWGVPLEYIIDVLTESVAKLCTLLRVRDFWNGPSLLHRAKQMSGVIRIDEKRREFIAACITMMHGDALMSPRKKIPAAADAEGVARITVSVPTSNYEHLLRLAESKRVSISWVVRDAVEKYLTADMPLFARDERLSR